MTKKIFRSIIFGSVITLLVSFVFIMGILYEYFNNQLLSELRNEATLAELGVEEYGVDYLENIDLENRVTWIDKDGTVLYDTTVDAAKLENHADREEFKEAVESKFDENECNAIFRGENVEVGLDILYNISVNRFNGRENIQLVIKDMRFEWMK